MSDHLFTLAEIGRAVESAVHVGDGNAVIRLTNQWNNQLHRIRQSGELPDMELRDVIKSCIRMNKQWLNTAIQAQTARAQELKRIAVIRHKRGLVHHSYTNQHSAVRHNIYRSG